MERKQMRKKCEAEPLFRFHEVSVDDLHKFPDAIEDIIRGRYQGLIIHGVFDPETVAELTSRMDRGAAPITRTSFPTPVYTDKGGLAKYRALPAERTRLADQEADDARGYLMGTPMTLERDEQRYFAAAASFRAGCRVLFEGLPDFEERMTEVFGAVAGGRQVRIPPGPGGASYAPATIRVLSEGLEIGIHADSDFIHLPLSRQVAEYADVSSQLSYFVTLRVPEDGGELVVYGLEWSDVQELRTERDSGSPGCQTNKVLSLLEQCDSMTFKPGPGDLLLFDGGRYYHRVTHIRGPRARITIGGFLVVSTDDRVVYYWS
jgi:hypothetical protein